MTIPFAATDGMRLRLRATEAANAQNEAALAGLAAHERHLFIQLMTRTIDAMRPE